MSFSQKSPNLPQSSSGIDPKLSSGYKADDVVPMGWGRDVFAAHWVSDKYDQHTAYGGKNMPEWQYCSMAAVYRDGPIDYVGRVFRDGKVIATLDYTFAAGEESHTFTINANMASGRSWQAVVHRGTEDAPASICANLNALTGQNHPPMRGYAWIEWLNIDLGQGSQSLPSLAVEMGRFAPALAGYTGGGFIDYGVNPFLASYALCTAVTGGDFDSALIDEADIAAVANALESTGVAGRTGPQVYCHPTLSQSMTLGDALSQIIAYVDGYVYPKDGKLHFGWFPSASVDPATLPEISEHDLEELPSGGGFPDWNDGATSVVVTFKNDEKDFGDDAARYNAPANRESTITAAPVRKDRPWIHKSDQAASLAAEYGVDPQSGTTGTSLTVFKSRAVTTAGAPLMPGDLLNWDYNPHSLDLVCRVTERRLRMGVASDTITIQREPGAYPRPYVAPVDPRVLSADEVPGEISVADVRFWLLPSGLTDVRELAVLINRSKRSIYRADIHMSTSGSAPWEVILDSRFFSAKTAVSSAITNADGTVRVTSTSVDFARMAAQNAVAQADDTLLLLIDNELMSVGDITVVASNTYDLTILRGRRGTAAAAHASAAIGWLFLRSEIASVEHQELYRVRDGSNAYNAGIATKYFKVQLFTTAQDGAAKPDDPGISFTLSDLSASETLGYTISLSSEAKTVACASDGTVNVGQLGASGIAKTVVKVVRGTTALSEVSTSPNSDQFSIALGTLTNTTATKEANDTVRCDTLTADTGTIDIAVTVAGAFTVTRTFTVSKAKAGATGSTGSTGSTGATGNTVKRIYTRSTIVPGTPSGNSPLGWSFSVPSGSDALWQSDGTFDPSGNIIGSWSTPQRISGNVVFYPNGNPATVLSGYALLEGDLAFDLSDGNRPYRWENPGSGYQWVAKPFGDSAIANLAAGKITAGTIQAAISIGTTGSLTAGSGYGQFYVDQTKLQYGNMQTTPWGGGSGYGTQTVFTSGTHTAAMGAYNYGGDAAFVSVGNSASGGLAQMTSNGLVQGTSMRCGTGGFEAQGTSLFDDVATFTKKMRLTGLERFEFNNAGTDVAYLTEYWGGSYYGDSTHPWRVRGAALCLDGCSNGAGFTPGRFYVTDSVYLYESGGALYLHDTNGDRALT